MDLIAYLIAFGGVSYFIVLLTLSVAIITLIEDLTKALLKIIPTAVTLAVFFFGGWGLVKAKQLYFEKKNPQLMIDIPDEDEMTSDEIREVEEEQRRWEAEQRRQNQRQ